MMTFYAGTKAKTYLQEIDDGVVSRIGFRGEEMLEVK